MRSIYEKFRMLLCLTPEYGPMRIDEIQKLFDGALMRVASEEGLTAEKLELFAEQMADTVLPMADDVANVLYASLTKRMSSMLKERRRDNQRFLKRHAYLWQEGLDSLEALLVAAFELGEGFNAQYRLDAAHEQDYQFEALTRLHARAIHVAQEVLILLRSGYADGAHARWRTVHEIAVVADFVAGQDNNVAKRYLDHDAIESYKAILQYQEYADQLGQKRFSEDEVRELKSLRDELCFKYGDTYSGEYGWAAEALGVSKPKFYDIEKASGLSHWRPYYRMASHNVHANPKGANFRLGLSSTERMLLAGPSNYGLTDPAQGVAYSVAQATISLLNFRYNLDTIVYGKVLLKFADEVGAAFWNTQQAMEAKSGRHAP